MSTSKLLKSFDIFFIFIQKQKIKLVLIIPVILMLGHLEKRPLNHEGGQSNIRNLADKVDWWGTILPIITPYKSFKAGSFLLSVITLIIFLIGLILILKNTNLKSFKLVIFLILAFVGLNFVIANSRDSFVLSFSILNFGLILFYRRYKSRSVLILIMICLVVMVSFKYLTSIAIVIFLISILLDIDRNELTKKIIPVFSLSILIIISGVVLDKGLGRIVNLKESFPEQQPIYQDLASFYCWSDDPTTRLKALNALKPVLATQTPSDICLTLRPNSWGYLIDGGNFFEQGVKAPLVKISEGNSEDLGWVRSGWVRVIITDPVDYIQFKLISLTQVISVGHPFKYPFLITDSYYENPTSETIVYELPTLLTKVSLSIWKLQHKILSLIGSTYIFSIPLMFLTLFLYQMKFKKFKLFNNSMMLIYICNFINVILLSIGFVSDEARYVFPMIFLTYVFILFHDKSTPVLSAKI